MVQPEPGRAAAEAFVSEHLGHLTTDAIAGSGRFAGGQIAADVALERFDVTGYARRRNEVHPPGRRGASSLSPYIRHGLLRLQDVWDAVSGGPARDVSKFRDELLWQEFARHWYARLGERTRRGVRNEIAGAPDRSQHEVSLGDWNRELACLEKTVGELEQDGWLVNQTRMWLSSQWTIRDGRAWQDGEDLFFRHLLDGSRAANRLGWQWTTGVGSSKSYGFSRWQVEKRSPGLCKTCAFNPDCPIQDWPANPTFVRIEASPRVKTDPDVERTAGPREVAQTYEPDVVWLTAESLGADDPALASHPNLPAIFVFDEPLLTGLRLSSKRLVFLVETLAELAIERPVELVLGRPAEVLASRRVAVTFAPVPGFRRRAAVIEPAEVHPWPWLVQPAVGSVSSFSAWRKAVKA